MSDLKELNDTLKQVSNDLTRVSDDLTRKAEAAMNEAKNAGTLSAETKAAVDKLIAEQTEAAGKVAAVTARLEEVEQRAVRRGGSDGGEAETPGNQLIKSSVLEGVTSSIQRGKVLNVGIKLTAGVRAALLSADVAEGVVEPQRLPGIDVMPKQKLFIRDLIGKGRTTSPAIFWVQQTGFVNNAAVVAEGAQKPISTISFDTKITPVVTIAHLFKASKQILDDFAQLQSTVDSELRFGLRYVEEQEILFGAGGAGNVEGIVPQAEAFAPAFEPEKRTKIDDLRLAILQAQLARLPVDGFVLHSTDWAEIELTKDDVGGYILANPQRLAGPSLWGRPIVETEIPEFLGEFLTGPFEAGAQWFDREDANVVISTENADDFEKNMVTIRAEERGALAVKRPEGFITGPFGEAVAP